jgi:glycosyltransferase involved in cell wall biosynthesis
LGRIGQYLPRLDRNFAALGPRELVASLRTAKQARAATLIEYPNLHPRSWQREVSTECHRFKVPLNACASLLPNRLIQRMEREFVECDKIVVPSTAARRSFESFSYASKATVVAPGVDHELFAPVPSAGYSRPSLFRVCYVGRVELAKGMAYLLQAWKNLNLKNAELLLVGEYRSELKHLLAQYAGSNVRIVGLLSPAEVADCYRSSSLFVFPSVNEGFGMVLLEAMASGLPVIASQGTGADDCVTHGEDGFVVPARNVAALEDTLLWCYQHQDDAKSIGENARSKIEAQFTLAHYNHRVIDLYQSVAPAAPHPPAPPRVHLLEIGARYNAVNPIPL